MKIKLKQGQEEMVGFVVILVIVGVILLVLFSFMFGNSNNNNTQNYEVENFVTASLQYTTGCENQIEFMSIERLINACDIGTTCLDGRDSCEVLNETIIELMKSGWNVNNQSSVKGYILTISGETEKLSIKEGNQTNNYVGGFQDFANNGQSYHVSLNVYS